MSIYSANRTGSMSVATVAANESYAPVDLGRIMYESQRNDMAIFEAILASDFSEMTSLREGTLLESEIAALNEASAKDLLGSLKKRLQGFWAKIKHAFQVATQKISAYILRDGKAFAKDFREAYAKAGKTFSGDVKYKGRTNFEIKIPTADEVESIIRSDKDTSDKLKSADVVARALSKYTGEAVKNTREYSAKMAEKCFAEKAVKAEDIEGMLKTIENASTVVKELRTAEKKTGGQIARVGKMLKDAEREIEKANKSTKQSHANTIHNITALVSAYETIVSVTTRTAINVTKAEVRQNRSALSKVMSSVKHEGTVLAESAAIAAEDEVDDALIDIPGEETPVDAETQEAIDAVVAGADAEIAAECGKNC